MITHIVIIAYQKLFAVKYRNCKSEGILVIKALFFNNYKYNGATLKFVNFSFSKVVFKLRSKFGNIRVLSSAIFFYIIISIISVMQVNLLINNKASGIWNE